ncbi:MAG: hypothetical protein HYY24_10565 [Verrucomicrobia bacterium]|nr:hypothetical protein [Verrucomicrobiota bacterium]
MLLLPATSPGATFTNKTSIKVEDPTGSLTSSSGTFTVSCWFRISIPSNSPLTEDMVILMDRADGNEAANFSYLIRFNAMLGDVEFVTRGSVGTYSKTLIQRPYLDRWYHVAVTRSGAGGIGSFNAYVDGRALAPFNEPANIGTTTGGGLAIGGISGTSRLFFGDIIEIAFYQSKLEIGDIQQRMFLDQRSFANLKGYYKLASSTNSSDLYRNFVPSPAEKTDPAEKVGSGTVEFEETDAAGEQSTFDSRKNHGENALAPLSGAFTWQQTALARAVPGIAFDFRYGYSSGTPTGPSADGAFDPYTKRSLGPGWRHSFDTRLFIESNPNELKLLTWDGAIETWTRTNLFAPLRIRHREYRGELTQLPTGELEWTTPERLVYRFRDPTVSSSIAGRLAEIRDFNGNSVKLLWNEDGGYLTNVEDTAAGRYEFNYDTNRFLLTNVAFGQWSVNFSYDGNNRLIKKSVTGPPGYTGVNTTWQFNYSAKQNSSNLLESVIDPRGNTNIYVEYDKYGRKIEENDALDRATKTEYGVPEKRQIRHTDPDNKQWLETYDRKGRITKQQDPLVNVTEYTYDDAGNRTSITEPLSFKTFFGYDDRANVIARTNALGEIATWKFHSFFNKAIQEVTPQPPDAAGWTNWTNHFVIEDATGNLLRHYDELGTLVSDTYKTNGLVETSTDANGKTTRLAYDTNGFLIARTDAAGFTTRYGYNEVGWKLAETNALGQVTTFAYDVNGNVVRRVDPLQRVFVSEYDANGNLLKQFDAKGKATVYAYDAANQRTKMTDRAGNSWNYAYTSRGELLTVTDPNPIPGVVTNSYDEANRLGRVDYPRVGDGRNFIEYQYDKNGNLTNLIDKADKHWKTEYDQLNRVIAETDPEGNTKRTTYDVAGRIEKIITPRGFVTTHSYDGRGRLTLWKDAEDFEWRYTYDGVGNILDIEDALQGHYVMAYGPRNERRSEKNQDNFEWRYEYDELLRLKKQIDPNSTTRTLAYDAGGRVESVTFNTGRVSAFAYDSNDNPEVLVRTGSGPPTISVLGYDVRDKVIEYADAFGKRINYDYDQLGRVETLVYPDGKKLTYEYDPLSRLTNQVFQFDPQRAFRTTYAYDAADRLIGRTYPNGVAQINGFDKAGRLTNLTYQASSTPNPAPSNPVAIALTYAYDANGNKTGSTEKGTLNWKPPAFTDEAADYTRSGRLKTRTITPLASSTTSAAVGIPSPGGEGQGEGGSNSAPGAAVVSPSPLGGERDDSSNPVAAEVTRLTSNEAVKSQSLLTSAATKSVESGTWSYAYDPSGNMTNATSSAGVGYALTYDEDNRTMSIRYETAGGTTIIVNRYDAFGRRVARTMNGTETRYVLDLAGGMERILCDVDANNAITAWYVHGPDLAFKVDAAGNLTCYHADAMANIIALSDGTTNLVAQYAYTPYGRLLGSTNYSALDPRLSTLDNPYLFVGSQGVMEELPGLYFMRARYYSAEAAVFLSTDPVKHIGPGWKPVAFAYADATPIVKIDPNGELVVLPAIALAYVVGVYVVLPTVLIIYDVVNGVPYEQRQEQFLFWQIQTDTALAVVSPVTGDPPDDFESYEDRRKKLGQPVHQQNQASTKQPTAPATPDWAKPGYMQRGTDSGYRPPNYSADFQSDVNKQRVELKEKAVVAVAHAEALNGEQETQPGGGGGGGGTTSKPKTTSNTGKDGNTQDGGTGSGGGVWNWIRDTAQKVWDWLTGK